MCLFENLMEVKVSLTRKTQVYIRSYSKPFYMLKFSKKTAPEPQLKNSWGKILGTDYIQLKPRKVKPQIRGFLLFPNIQF